MTEIHALGFISMALFSNANICGANPRSLDRFLFGFVHHVHIVQNNLK
jgi:hypothetical protein